MKQEFKIKVLDYYKLSGIGNVIIIDKKSGIEKQDIFVLNNDDTNNELIKIKSIEYNGNYRKSVNHDIDAIVVEGKPNINVGDVLKCINNNYNIIIEDYPNMIRTLTLHGNIEYRKRTISDEEFKLTNNLNSIIKEYEIKSKRLKELQKIAL